MIHLFVTGYGRPDLLKEQKRLLDKWLFDPFRLTVVDNTPLGSGSEQMQKMCKDLGLDYWRSPSKTGLHPGALDLIAKTATTMNGCDYWMTLDHDVFPRRGTRLIKKIKIAGFYGIGQWHTPTSTRYLWPGFCGFSNKWLAGRVPDFGGIRAPRKADDGDCGSMLHTLFTTEEFEQMPRTEHGYRVIRPEDEYGLQSYGIEFFDSMIHFTNASHWMSIPDPDKRDEILMKMLSEL